MFFCFSKKSVQKTSNSLLKEVSYYQYSLDVQDQDTILTEDYYTEQIHTKSVKYNLYDSYMPTEYFSDLQLDDIETLIQKIYGIRVADNARFSSVLEMLIQIVKQPRNLKKYKLNALDIISRLIDLGRANEIHIVNELVEKNMIETLCDILIEYGQDGELCSSFIKLMIKILEEESEEIQDKLYEYLSLKDLKNRFMVSIKKFLLSNFDSLRSSESLRNEVLDTFSSEKNQKDKLLVEKESNDLIEEIINCIEMLRLMCENHYQKLQEYMRVQKDGNKIRFDSINMIEVISGVLENYTPIFGEFNSRLGEKIFEFFTEIL